MEGTAAGSGSDIDVASETGANRGNWHYTAGSILGQALAAAGNRDSGGFGGFGKGGGNVRNAVSRKAENIAANAAKGKAGEAITRAKLGDKVAGEQITFKSSDGTRSRPDFVTTDKGIVESKTGNSPLSPGQEKLKADIDAGRPVTPVGQSAANAGPKPGEPTVMTSCKVDRTCP